MKVALCVRYDCNNYGSMLQIFATQQSLKAIGYDYELLRYDKVTISPSFVLNSLPRLFNADFVRGKLARIKKAYKKRRHQDVLTGDSIRRRRFAEYRNKYLGPYSPVFKGYDSICDAASKYDAVMVGSDQLWAPAGLESNYYNLLFVPDDITKISYATSFGVSQIPKKQIKKTAAYLKRIEYISVREVSGAKIVKALTGRDVVVAADPTLMLTQEEWCESFPPKELFAEKYIFAYFLGDNQEHRGLVNELGRLTGYKIICCPHLDSFIEADCGFGDVQRYDTDPEDFLNLIRGAEYICTDSFHGSIFSILNHKRFVTFNRFKSTDKLSKNSRIDSLFEKLGIEDRRNRSTTAKDLLDQLNAPIDFTEVEDRLEEIREETKKFLRNALLSN